MSGATHIPNIDFLGRCYDIADTDPLDLGTSAKYENAIDIDVAEGRTVVTRDGTYSIPKGVRHKAIFSMSWETQSAVISSSFEFREEFRRTVNAEAGIPGAFEFSASKSEKDIARRTESRKQSFVYSRAYQENHGLQLDLANEKAPLAVTPEFADAVRQLPVGNFPDVVAAYDAFLRRFGTHFTTDIVLGGLAFQRTSGSSAQYLVSEEKENELKVKAAVEIEQLKLGAGVETARTTASKVDRESALERTSLEFRGGYGSPAGIDSAWIMSLHDRPAIVKASMERLSSLLTSRFFPRDAEIEERGFLLDLAISEWVRKQGRPSCDTAPLRYGEPLVLTTLHGSSINIGTIQDDNRIYFMLRNGVPVIDSGDIAAVRLESVDGRRPKAIVLAGDTVRIRLLQDGSYIGGSMAAVNSASQAGLFTVLFHGDDIRAPSRLGQYFMEADQLQFAAGRLGAPEQALTISTGPRILSLGHPGHVSAFSLKRCDESQAQPQPGELRVFRATGAQSGGPEATVKVPGEYKVLSGGARVNYTGPGNLLTAAFPKDVRTWVARAKAHGFPDPATIDVWAIAIFDPTDEWEVKVFSHTSTPANYPSATAAVAAGYVLTGGGAEAHWKTKGALLTASCPDPEKPGNWVASSKEHLYPENTTITAYAVGIKPKGRSDAPAAKIFSQTSGASGDPSTEVSPGPGYTLVGGGAKVSWIREGSLLTASYPDFNNNKWKVRSKAHEKPEACTITAYAIGLLSGEARRLVAAPKS